MLIIYIGPLWRIYRIWVYSGYLSKIFVIISGNHWKRVSDDGR